MHLIIQIPCYNEEKTLPDVLAGIPAEILGVGSIETLVIDDGSTDNTTAIARRLGVDHIVKHPYRRGLATAFQTGLDACLRLGADVIVNTDGDNQYPQADIPRLIGPILDGEADIVVGDRQTRRVVHFSLWKRVLQQGGSWIVRLASGTEVPDATSGFRAFSREAALRLTVLTRYTYTLETIIQAGKKGLVITSVPIEVNAPRRESRLIKSNWDYVKQSAATILRLYAFYEPLKTFSWVSLPFFLIGGYYIGRFVYFFLTGQSARGSHIQSVVIASTLMILGFLIFMLGVIGDLIATNRLILEETLYRTKRMEIEHHPKRSATEEPSFEERAASFEFK
ncbi:MAG: glycosyltransferase family 2 protein [Anaerolineae bacterium]